MFGGTHGIDDLEKLQDRELAALDRAGLKNLQYRKKTMSTDDEILGLTIFPKDFELESFEVSS